MTGRSELPGAGGGQRPSGGEWFRYHPQGRNAAHAGTPRGSDLGPRNRPRRRRGRLLGYLLVAVFALLLGMGAGYARGYFASGELGEEVTVVIASGDSLSTVAGKLEAAGVVEHAGAFVLRTQSDGYSKQLKPGTYLLRRNLPYEDLVATLVEGQAPPAVMVTIPEGSTLAQSADLVAAKLARVTAKDYIRAAREKPVPFTFKGYTPGKTLEGLLFPATYEVDPAVKARPFVERQLAVFTENFAHVDMTRARKADLTPYDVVIIASMIEREAQVGAEREVVAAVIWNRLRDGMFLQIDATIQYALGKTKPVLTFDDLKIDSPYNTYTNSGLPPTPIANPGLAAMQAAADPAAVDYLYYVARADGTGRHYFSRSYEEFLANQAKAAHNSQE